MWISFNALYSCGRKICLAAIPSGRSRILPRRFIINNPIANSSSHLIQIRLGKVIVNLWEVIIVGIDFCREDPFCQAATSIWRKRAITSPEPLKRTASRRFLRQCRSMYTREIGNGIGQSPHRVGITMGYPRLPIHPSNTSSDNEQPTSILGHTIVRSFEQLGIDILFTLELWC